jgi:anti-sigma regulatory factor (Ser/Thr protein kinase)
MESRGVALMSARLPPTERPVESRSDAGEMAANQGYHASLSVPNRVESVRPAAMFLVHTARALNVAAASKPLFEVAVTEALTNAVKHGRSRDGRGVIVCELELDPRRLTLRILDAGPGFKVPAPRIPNLTPEEVETLPESGYGLPIIQSVFPSVRAVRVNGTFGLELSLPLM